MLKHIIYNLYLMIYGDVSFLSVDPGESVIEFVSIAPVFQNAVGMENAFAVETGL